LFPGLSLGWALPDAAAIAGSIGNQAAPHYGDAHQFYNAARKVKTNKLLVGSQFVDPKDPNAKHQQPHGSLPPPLRSTSLSLPPPLSSPSQG